MEASVTPKVALELYGFVGPYAALRGYLGARVGLADSTGYELYTGIDVNAGVHVQAFGRTFADYDTTVYTFERVLVSSDDQCTSHQHLECYASNVFWVDSCGNYEELYESCDPEGESCLNAECVEKGVPCTPAAETCDGKDNDCDGYTDEGDVCGAGCIDECQYSGQRTCRPNAIPGGNEGWSECGQHDADECLDWGWLFVCGEFESCEDGYCVPCAYAPEICDGKDNDCDGYTDEDGVCCIPSCYGTECGSDGCGGSCGSCGANEYCSGGTCVGSCSPNCAGKECGSDGCGGSCGFCPSGQTCDPVLAECTGGCVPDCSETECGGDGCGGTCCVAQADGTVIQIGKGLLWQMPKASGSFNWGEASAYCSELILAGHSNWRLPSLGELSGIHENDSWHPPFEPGGSCWTGSECEYGHVFYYSCSGCSLCDFDSDSHSVRCVFELLLP